MLSKQVFMEAMNAIVKHRDIMEEIREPLRQLGGIGVDLDTDTLHREALLKVLREATGDESDWIGWWLYEDVPKIVEWEEDGETVKADITEVSALYDFLKSNIEEAASATLPLTTLADDCNGKPRQAIEKSDFELYFDACLRHIDRTGTTLLVCEDCDPKYVVMSMERYCQLNGEKYRPLEVYDCPHCGKKLRVMYVSETQEDGGSDVIAHCESCLASWQWHRDAEGKAQEIERYFFG